MGSVQCRTSEQLISAIYHFSSAFLVPVSKYESGRKVARIKRSGIKD
jgi:hypothetical protein